jgi:protein-arginine kinase
MAEEKYIQFVANYDDWVAIKKLKIEPGMDPKTVLEFLASLTTSVDRKVEENLGKIVDLKKLDAAIASVSIGKSEEEIASALKEVNSRKVSSVINEVTALEKFQKNEQKELADFCRAYAARKILKNCGAMIDYSEIEIPGLKRAMKTGKK